MIPNASSVVVIGAGPAGSVTALLLARAGIHVVLLESSRSRSLDRGEVLAAEGRSALVELGLWDRVPATAVNECPTTLIAWRGVGAVERFGITNPYGCGWQLTRPVFDEWLRDEAAAAGVTVVRPMSVTNVRRSAKGLVLEVAGESSIRGELAARFIVDARGRSSGSGSWRSSIRTRHDALCAVVTRVPARDDASGLLVEAAPDGWWYSIPGSSGQLLAGFLTDADVVAKAGGAGSVLLRALEDAPLTRERIRSGDGPVSVVSACSASLDSVAGDDWLAVGDAALARDPLSGEGTTAAIRSARHAAQAIREHFCGDSQALPRYAGEVKESTLEYLSARQAIYRSQPRWSDRPFWRRRQLTQKHLNERRFAHERN